MASTLFKQRDLLAIGAALFIVGSMLALAEPIAGTLRLPASPLYSLFSAGAASVLALAIMLLCRGAQKPVRPTSLTGIGIPSIFYAAALTGIFNGPLWLFEWIYPTFGPLSPLLALIGAVAFVGLMLVIGRLIDVSIDPRGRSSTSNDSQSVSIIGEEMERTL